jgi:hypothetical protein
MKAKNPPRMSPRNRATHKGAVEGLHAEVNSRSDDAGFQETIAC